MFNFADGTWKVVPVNDDCAYDECSTSSNCSAVSAYSSRATLRAPSQFYFGGRGLSTVQEVNESPDDKKRSAESVSKLNIYLPLFFGRV
jgi:hypothetical protein